MLNVSTIESLFPHTQFKAIVLRGIVTTGDHNAPLHIEVKQGKVQKRSGTKPNIYNIESTFG